jgi:hypothetical protein
MPRPKKWLGAIGGKIGFGLLLSLITPLSFMVPVFKRRKKNDTLGRPAFTRSIQKVRRMLEEVTRRGWRQFYLPANTESVEEHISGTISIGLELANEESLPLRDARRAVKMTEVHELIESLKGKDKPLIDTRLMPRSKAGRIQYQNTEWVPPTWEDEKKRLRSEFEEAEPLLQEWLEANFTDSVGREEVLELLKDFYYVRGRAAELFHEAHALQPAEKATLLHIEDPNKLPKEAVYPFFRRAENLIRSSSAKRYLQRLKDALESS